VTPERLSGYTDADGHPVLVILCDCGMPIEVEVNVTSTPSETPHARLGEEFAITCDDCGESHWLMSKVGARDG
jgi:hypothetical protein